MVRESSDYSLFFFFKLLVFSYFRFVMVRSDGCFIFASIQGSVSIHIDRPNSVCGEDVTFQDYPAHSIGITVCRSDAELFV